MKKHTILTKIILLVFFTIQYNFSYSQCYDVFDRICDCPSENDSLVIYNNAIKVYEFYEKNPDYIKIKSKRLTTKAGVCEKEVRKNRDSTKVKKCFFIG